MRQEHSVDGWLGECWERGLPGRPLRGAARLESPFLCVLYTETAVYTDCHVYGLLYTAASWRAPPFSVLYTETAVYMVLLYAWDCCIHMTAVYLSYMPSEQH